MVSNALVCLTYGTNDASVSFEIVCSSPNVREPQPNVDQVHSCGCFSKRKVVSSIKPTILTAYHAIIIHFIVGT